MKSLKWIAPVLVLLVFITSCDGATDLAGTQTTTSQETTTTSVTTTTSGNETQPTEELSVSEPLVCFMVANVGWHNYFTCEIVNNRLIYQAIRYDYYPLDSDSINNIKPGDYIAYVGELWGSSDDLFLVYVSNGKLYYKVIDPYAIPGPDPERCSMGAIHEGILDGYATSIAANYVRFTYWGKYGVNVNWTDNYGKGHYAVIDQWDGVTEKSSSAADDRPQIKETTARGRIVPLDGYLENWAQTQETSAPGITMNWVKESENHLEMKFDPTGGKVTGSFWWRYSMNFGYEDTGTGSPTTTVVMMKIGDLTGTYSGGETGSFEGDVTGTITGIFNGHADEDTIGIMEGTWTAELDADGHITGLMHFTLTYAENVYDDWFDFEATLCD